MTSDRYAISGGVEGRERLRLLSRVFREDTALLLDRSGVPAGGACLDLGCGGGDVTLEIARRAGPDAVVLGVDLDPVPLEIARTEARDQGFSNVEYRQHDVTQPLVGREWDFVYMRFLLSHLSDPVTLLGDLRGRMTPGGRICTMDVDFRGHFAWPESAAMDRFVDLYTQVVALRGGNANIGPQLPSLLQAAGFEDVRMHLSHRAAMEGEVKLLTAITMQLIASAAATAGLASENELKDIVETLYAEARNPKTVMGLPRVIQAWGCVPD